MRTRSLFPWSLVVVMASLSSTRVWAQSTNPADYLPYDMYFDGIRYFRGEEAQEVNSRQSVLGATGSAMLVFDRQEQDEKDWILVEGRGLVWRRSAEEPQTLVTTVGQFVTSKFDGTFTTAADYDRSKLNAALEVVYRSTVNTKRPMLHAPFLVGLSVEAATTVCASMGCTLSVPPGTPSDRVIATQNPAQGAILAKPALGTNTITATVSTATVAAPAGDTQATAIAVSMTDKVVKFVDSISPEFKDNIAPTGGSSGRADIYYKMVFSGPTRMKITAPRNMKERVLVAAYTESGGTLSPLASVTDIRVDEIDVKIPAAGNVFVVAEFYDFAYGRLNLRATWD